MEALAAFLKRKDIEISARRYGIDTLTAMAQELFCSLLIDTIINTIGAQLHLAFLTSPVATIAGTECTVGGLASAMSGPAMTTTIGRVFRCPPLMLFSLITVGFASNALDGAGGPLAVPFIAVLAARAGKAVSKETWVDTLVTPLVTITVGLFFSALFAPALGRVAIKVGDLVMWVTGLQPFLMGILVSFVVGIALALPISSTAICAALGLTGLTGDAASTGCCVRMAGLVMISYPENDSGDLVSQDIGTPTLQMGSAVGNPKVQITPCVTSMITDPVATCMLHLQQNDAATASGMGTCGLVGPLGVYTGWVEDVTAGQKAATTGMNWFGMLLVAVILPVALCPLIRALVCRMGLAKDGDLKLV